MDHPIHPLVLAEKRAMTSEDRHNSPGDGHRHHGSMSHKDHHAPGASASPGTHTEHGDRTRDAHAEGHAVTSGARGAKPHAAHDTHVGHDKHAGHSVATFRDRFWLSLLLTVPTLV